jgi:homoserine kinase type II
MQSRHDDLTAVLALYPAGERPVAPPEALGNAGGGSGATLWRYRSGRGIRVVRAWPIDGPRPQDLERIHGWLRRVSALDFVPVPLEALDGRTFHDRAGRLWELAPWCPGTSDLARPPLAVHRRAGFAGLAAFHQALGEESVIGPSPGLQLRLQEMEFLLRGGFDSWYDLVMQSARDGCQELALSWLDRARRHAPVLREELKRDLVHPIACQPCLRDARPDHFLFQNGRLTGLIDFGAMGIDCVAADLARLLSDWIGTDPQVRNSALDEYAAIHPLGEVEWTLVRTFERSLSLLGAGHWVRWHFVEKRPFHDPQAVRRGLERGLERLYLLESTR